MPMNIRTKLYRCSCWESAVRGRTTCESLISGTGVRFTPAFTWEFFAPSSIECTDVTDFASRLRVHIGKLWPLPAPWHAALSTFTFKDPATASHIFVRQGALRGAPQAPCVGPYRVLHRGNKTYTIEILGAAINVSIDRLKPALCPTC